jgi:phytoene dehydrogenase-like protein
VTDFDAIVIGAGHNGLTAAAVMARGGMKVLCLEKNHFIGGMATTTELVRGYRFELAGSIQFPIPNEIYDDLGFAACPIYEPEVQSASVGPSGQPPLFLYSNPDRLLEHLTEAVGLDAVMGMAEIAAWADAPARALGRFEVRKPPRSLDEMWACASNETEREAMRVAMFGSVMDVIDRHLPDRDRHAQLRSMLSFLSVNSTYRGPSSPGSALCLAFALASPGEATMSKVRGGIGVMSDHLLGLFEQHGGELRRHTKVSEIVIAGGRVTGVKLGDGEVATAPIVVSNLDPTTTFTELIDRAALPVAFAQRVDAIDHRAAYFQIHFALNGLPEFVGPYEALNEGDLRHNVTFFGTAEQMQRDFEGCVRGIVPGSPSCNLQIPSLRDPDLAPPGKHAASGFAFYFPIGSTREDQTRLRDEMAERIVAKITTAAPGFPDLIERQFSYPAYT